MGEVGYRARGETASAAKNKQSARHRSWRRQAARGMRVWRECGGDGMADVKKKAKHQAWQ
jgi:hypothetical protein